MKEMTIKEIAKACEGTFVGDANLLDHKIKNITTDSRQENADCLFIPIIGEKFDGHDFIDKAFENGVVCTLSQNDIPQKPYIKVKSTFQALKDIAEYYRSLFDVKVVAITGSVGKTTTKEMVYSVLTQKFNVLKSEKNYNNEIGVPQTLFNLTDEHDIAVIEMGMNHFGEISRLSKTARPDVCVITNIGHSHIGYLESRTGIFIAKCEIFDYMKQGGATIINGDDDLLYTLKSKDFDTEFYGFNEYNDIVAQSFELLGFKNSKCVIKTKDGSYEVEIPAPGRHMAYAAMSAYAIGTHFLVDKADIIKGIKEFVPVGNRMEVAETSKITILDDAYNASPESVKAAIDVLSYATQRKVCILGDMGELGDYAPKLHKEIGGYAAQKGVDLIICAGKLSAYIFEGAKNHDADSIWFESQGKMIENLKKLIKKGDTVLVKASRSQHFEKTVEALKEI